MPPHCDSKDGPVAQGALMALDIEDVNEALRFAPAEAETEIRDAFALALAARRSTPEARDVADLYFAETVVRLHRAGEGAPYTGLKPAGLEVGPIIPVAERCIDTGSVDELTALLSESLHHQVKHRFEHVMELKARSARGLAESREYTAAMLGLQVWAHKLHLTMESAAHEGAGEHHG